jgi:hypothetical protein
MAGVLKVICPTSKAEIYPSGYFVAGAVEERWRPERTYPEHLAGHLKLNGMVTIGSRPARKRYKLIAGEIGAATDRLGRKLDTMRGEQQ